MKILVVSLSGIGDTLIATPLIHELRLNFPDAAIDAFVLWRGSKDLLAGNPHLNAIHQWNLIREKKLTSLHFLLSLRHLRYDISINTHPQSRIHYRAVARLIRAGKRLSHQYDNASFLDGWLVDSMLPQDYAVHGVENNLRLLGLLGKKNLLPNHRLEVFPGAEERKWAAEFLATNELDRRTRLGVHVGSGGTKNLALKRWPLENYVELFKKLVVHHPQLTIILFGGPEEQQAHVRILQETLSSQVLAAETENLKQAAALIENCHAFLSVDTALMHLAAAVKVPNQIVIEAPTLNATNVPFGNSYQLVPNPAIQGRHLDYYRYDGKPIRGTEEELRRIMGAVTVEAVYETVRRCVGEAVRR